MQGRFYRSVNEEVPRRAFQNNSFGQESSDRGIKPILRPWGNAETGSTQRYREEWRYGANLAETGIGALPLLLGHLRSRSTQPSIAIALNGRDS